MDRKEFGNRFRETCFLRTLVCCRANVFALKKGLDGSMRRKARLVVCGNYERNMDLNTYAATSRTQSLRAFCAQAALHKLRIPPTTFKRVYLSADVERGVLFSYNHCRTAWNDSSSSYRAMYGLVDSARAWQRRQHLCLKALASLAATRTNVYSR